MFGIGGFELFLILLFIFIAFGPDKLPEIIKLAGSALKKFRAAKAEMDQVLHEEVIDPVMREAEKPDEVPNTPKQDINATQQKANAQNDNAKAALEQAKQKAQNDTAAANNIKPAAAAASQKGCA